MAIGSLIPFLLLPIAFRTQRYAALRTFLGTVSGVLILIQVFAMRWNVVIGGQMFSRSFRGFVHYNLTLSGREGLIAAILVLTLPLLALIRSKSIDSPDRRREASHSPTRSLQVHAAGCLHKPTLIDTLRQVRNDLSETFGM